jgi:hypothetical protein
MKPEHVPTFELEGEVVGQMSALVIPSQQKQCIRIPNLESPEIEDALAELNGMLRKNESYLNSGALASLTSMEKYPRST